MMDDITIIYRIIYQKLFIANEWFMLQDTEKVANLRTPRAHGSIIDDSCFNYALNCL